MPENVDRHRKFGLVQPVGEVRLEPGGRLRGPSVQPGVVPRLVQGVEGHAQLGEWGNAEDDAFRGQPRDVDGHAHALHDAGAATRYVVV